MRTFIIAYYLFYTGWMPEKQNENIDPDSIFNFTVILGKTGWY